MKTKAICCFPGVHKTGFVETATEFRGDNVLDACTMDYCQTAFDRYGKDNTENGIMESLIKSIYNDYNSDEYDYIFIPIMQSFVGRLEDYINIYIFALHPEDMSRVIYKGENFRDRKTVEYYKHCNYILETLKDHPNVKIYRLPKGEHDLPCLYYI